jgi:hypothetical protein
LKTVLFILKQNISKIEKVLKLQPLKTGALESDRKKYTHSCKATYRDSESLIALEG